MTVVTTIERVLHAGVLTPSLTTVPTRGATPDELLAEEALLGRRFSTDHRAVLAKWNGLDLEVLRIYGCGAVEPGLRRLVDEQVDWPEVRGRLVLGSDPAGFLYVEDSDGVVSSVDTKGGKDAVRASSFREFLCHHVFGAGAAEFAGPEWATELSRSGLANDAEK